MKKIVTLIAFLFVLASTFAQGQQADSIIRLLPIEKSDTGKVRKLIEIGRQLNYKMAKNDSAEFYLQQAVDLSRKIKNKSLEAEANYYLASYLVNSASYPRALVLSLQNLKLLEELKREHGIELNVNPDWNLRFYQTRLLVFIYSNIRDYEKQLEYVNQMKAIYKSTLQSKKNVSDNYLFTIYFNQSNAFHNLKKDDSAFNYLVKLNEAVSKKRDAQWSALVSNALGAHYEQQINTDSAMLYSRKAIPPAIESNRNDIITDAELRIGKMFHLMGNQDSALYYSRRTLNKLTALNQPTILRGAYKQLSEIFKSLGRFDSAYFYLQNFVVLKDSLQDFSKIAEAKNFAFNQTLVDQQVDQAKKEAAQETKNKIKFYSLVGIIAFILMATLLLMRNLRNKRKANYLLSKQKEEVQTSLSALKEAQAQLIQSEKMASLGELTAGIAHEIQNPLNFVNNFSEVNRELIDELQQELKDGKVEDAIAISNDIKENEVKINHHGKRADAIVKGMLEHSRSSSGQKVPADINALCDEYVRLSYHGLRAKDKTFNATIKTSFDPLIGKVNIIPQDIGRVILNLLNNAFYAVDDRKKMSGESYDPTVRLSTIKKNNMAEIMISDNGNGISPAIIDKIFQPFFTTKPTGSGTGLGLSLSYDIIKAHGGTLKVDTQEKEFTSFIITLPIQATTNS